MPRIARIVIPGWPHHVTQRGNFAQDVFRNDDDRLRYTNWLKEYSEKYGSSIIADCLMINHVHFIVIPEKSDSLAKTFNAAHMRYSQYLNKKMERSGHLWQNRFYSCVMDEVHLIAAAKYIELNPVRAGLVKNPWEWKWSSARAHIGECNHQFNQKDLFNLIEMDQASWKQYISSGLSEQTIMNIREQTLVGRPLGEKTFLEQIEKKLNRKIAALPVGRPPRN